MKPHTLAIAGILVVFILGIVALNAVQAQTPPAVPNVSYSAEYDRLTTNVPMVKNFVVEEIPIFKSGSNIKKALEVIIAASEDTGFVVVKDDDPYGVYFITADGDNLGEIFVYHYEKEAEGDKGPHFRGMDCSNNILDMETDNIENYLGSNNEITAKKFLDDYDCEYQYGYPISKFLYSDDVINGARVWAKIMKEKYAGEDVFITPGGSTTVGATQPATSTGTNPASSATPITPTPVIRACDISGVIIKYNSAMNPELINGKFGIGTDGQPNNIPSTDPLLSIASEDSRIPVSIIFQENSKSKYRLNINGFQWEEDNVQLQTQLCFNESGQWKEVWPTTTYSVYNNDSKKKKFETVLRNANSSTVFSSKISDRSGLPEVSARYAGGDRDKVTAYFYLKKDNRTLGYISIDAQKDTENIDYRFDIDRATYEQLIERVKAYKEFSPDDLRKEIQKIISLKGTKNLKNNDYPNIEKTTNIEVKIAEGVLNNGENYDNSYWYIKDMKTSGEYEVSIAIPGFRPVKKVVVIKTSDLSPRDPDRVNMDDIKYFNIKSEELKDDRCTACNTLQACLMCTDTAFVDKIASTK